jgi:4-hydroxyphenylpyruvate dioxygenase-like putative hemolysin
MEFLTPPESYYDSLIERLKLSKVEVKEDMDLVRFLL